VAAGNEERGDEDHRVVGRIEDFLDVLDLLLAQLLVERLTILALRGAPVPSRPVTRAIALTCTGPRMLMSAMSPTVLTLRSFFVSASSAICSRVSGEKQPAKTARKRPNSPVRRIMIQVPRRARWPRTQPVARFMPCDSKP